MNNTDWVSPKEAAAMLGLSKQTIRKWCKSGQLESVKLGYNVIRISTASIERFMEQNKQMR